jgi:hypothetical protein
MAAETTDREARRRGGLTVTLWLVAALLAEAEALLWLLERSFRP